MELISVFPLLTTLDRRAKCGN